MSIAPIDDVVSAAVDNFAEALRAIKSLKTAGIVDDYAIGGAMALAFWSEPEATFDLDVFVLLQQDGLLISLDPIYRWARDNGYPEQDEHIIVAGVPVQLIPAHNELAAEAIATAAELDYEDEAVRVIRPEYLIGLYLEPSARTAKRLARVAGLLDEGNVDQELLHDILTRYGLQLP